MLRVDKAIQDNDEVICNNISRFKESDRGLLSQNILAQFRNFVEMVSIKECFGGSDVDPYKYENNQNALKYIKKDANLKFLYQFHALLQKSVSHFTFDKDGSERLTLKYYEYLLKIKNHLKKKHNISVLHNLHEFPLNTDKELQEYYAKIATCIENPVSTERLTTFNERYYIKKKKPFFANGEIYYEITFTEAFSNSSKFDRVIAFTKLDFINNYAIKFTIIQNTVSILGKNIPILIIDSFEVSIRPCELNNYSKIFGPSINITTSSNEYHELMKFLSTVGMSLTELVSTDQDYYDRIKKEITIRTEIIKIYTILDLSRNVILKEKPGSNVLRYLLLNMDNRIIKNQLQNYSCVNLSNLNFKNGCIPFDKMPYCTSLMQHNPMLYDLIMSISSKGREHELFARKIKNNIEIEGKLFTNKIDVNEFGNIDNLIRTYNDLLYHGHIERKMKVFKNHIYIKGYIMNITKIINEIKALSLNGCSQYTSSVESWIINSSYIIDDKLKEDSLKKMFSESQVALIYGSAGTGKSTHINHISNFYSNKKKLFLANTHPALDNLRSKVKVANSEFMTIAKFLNNNQVDNNNDILIIDECSTVSNDYINRILLKAKFSLLVLVGDIYQIESISFGNWFELIRKFVEKKVVTELTSPFRTKKKELLQIWSDVRNLNNDIEESLVRYDYVQKLDSSIFVQVNKDEIILCLNYDGLYGINNINRLLQVNNTSPSFTLGINTYKVGDPILFNETNKYAPLIHNNSKGIISKIENDPRFLRFYIELDKAINEVEAQAYDFDLIEQSEDGNSIIAINIDRNRSTDEDDDHNSTIVPFQIAYAVSIHKAQGLEYDSVKIVITNESEELITHNVFYTAITRTKNKLKIYWSPESQRKVLENFSKKDLEKDANLLSKLSSIEML